MNEQMQNTNKRQILKIEMVKKHGWSRETSIFLTVMRTTEFYEL